MARIKHNVNTTILNGSSGSSNTVIDTSAKRDFDLQLIYGAGSSTTAKLQISVDGTNYADLTDASGASTQITLGTSGGSNQWQVQGLQAPFLKLVISGDAVGISAILSSDG
jgi:hypothetical protein